MMNNPTPQPEALEFFYQTNSVGIFDEPLTKDKAIISYMPYRGLGHLELRQALEQNDKIMCEIYMNDTFIPILVSKTDEAIQSLIVEL